MGMWKGKIRTEEKKDSKILRQWRIKREKNESICHAHVFGVELKVRRIAWKLMLSLIIFFFASFSFLSHSIVIFDAVFWFCLALSMKYKSSTIFSQSFYLDWSKLVYRIGCLNVSGDLRIHIKTVHSFVYFYIDVIIVYVCPIKCY